MQLTGHRACWVSILPSSYSHRHRKSFEKKNDSRMNKIKNSVGSGNAGITLVWVGFGFGFSSVLRQSLPLQPLAYLQLNRQTSHQVDQAGCPQIQRSPAFACYVLELRACATTLRWFNFEVVVVVIVVIFMCAHVCVHVRVPVWQSAYVEVGRHP